MTSEEKSSGCLASMTHQTALLIVAVLLGGLIFVNLYATGLVEEDTCKQIHPRLFQIQVEAEVRDPRLPGFVAILDDDYVKQRGLESAAREEGFELDAQGLPSNSCLSTYGHVDPNQNNAFALDQDGYTEFANWYNVFYETDEESVVNNPPDADATEIVSVSAEVELNRLGKNWLYFLLPAYVILMPIITIALLRGSKSNLWWYVMISLVAALAMTSALLYIEFADVTGIDTLAEFGTGIFGGTITGTALAFMSKITGG